VPPTNKKPAINKKQAGVTSCVLLVPYLACTWAPKRNALKILISELQGKGRLEKLGVRFRIILKWNLKKYFGEEVSGPVWPMIGANDGLF
jgi:hypothetical protein